MRRVRRSFANFFQLFVKIFEVPIFANSSFWRFVPSLFTTTVLIWPHPCHFFPFLKIKLALKGRRFSNTETIKKIWRSVSLDFLQCYKTTPDTFTSSETCDKGRLLYSPGQFQVERSICAHLYALHQRLLPDFSNLCQEKGSKHPFGNNFNIMKDWGYHTKKWAGTDIACFSPDAQGLYHLTVHRLNKSVSKAPLLCEKILLSALLLHLDVSHSIFLVASSGC